METPLDPLVADMVNGLDDDLREEFEERAGIVEFDAGKNRAHAECLALLDLLSRHPAALSGLSVMEIAFEAKTRWLLTNNLARARNYMGRIGATELGLHDPVDALNGPIRGMALLRPVS